MFFCGKKVCYLSMQGMEGEKRPLGFAKILGRKEEIQIEIQVKDAEKKLDGQYRGWILWGGQKICLGDIIIKRGCGKYEKCFSQSKEGVIIEGIHIEEGIPEQIWLESVQLVIKEEKEKRESEKESKKELETAQLSNEKGNVYEIIEGDKWEQIKSQYKNVHPFGDERLFVSIEPKDFVVLREREQRLIHNSFLLHGFYNYRHLILGRDTKLGSDYETCFYIGVPGVYFEREKMVAVMFGFEGFECEGAIDVGKFGYYMRQVEI